MKENNGWLKIESKKDLPKDGAECFFYDSENSEVDCVVFHDYSTKYILSRYTHYQLIIKPNPPVEL